MKKSTLFVINLIWMAPFIIFDLYKNELVTHFLIPFCATLYFLILVSGKMYDAYPKVFIWCFTFMVLFMSLVTVDFMKMAFWVDEYVNSVGSEPTGEELAHLLVELVHFFRPYATF